MDNQKIKVLEIISGLDIGGAHGGAERFGLELARNINSMRFEVHLCAFWEHGSEAEHHWVRLLQKENVHVFFASKWCGKSSIISYFKGLTHLTDLYLVNPPNIIHSNFQFGSLCALFVHLKTKIPRTVRTAHISKEWGTGWFSWILRQIFTKFFFPLSFNKQIGVSQTIVNQLNNYPITKLMGRAPVLIHNGFSMDLSVHAHTKQDTSKSTFTVGSLGRLTEQKGYIYLVDAAKEVISSKPNTHFVIGGDGPLRGFLERKIYQAGIGANFYLAGTQNHPINFLRTIDLFVLPSLYEGFPTVILESMVLGIPVIATGIPGNNEIIEDRVNGWLIPPRDSHALANSIIHAIENPSLCSLQSIQAYKRIQRYNIQSIARQYERLFFSIIGKEC
ncbi:MAG: glycosyltransferase family 4 protein [Anaerolineaceae bacterium]|nr:glycosyltransferase family 4 protein [Anaerolineaceae bacterium]